MFHVEHLFDNQFVDSKIISILLANSDNKMFRKNNTTKQPDLFRNFAGQLTGKAYNLFTDKLSWHNVFRENVFHKIKESLFSDLFDDKNGAPNYPINILICMMILKEGFGWSDSELFESVRFNILVKSALGMTDFTEKEPAEASYYNFRLRLRNYQLEKGEDLYGKLFSELTKEQVIDFKVDGRSIRMDSKLLGSNIARVSRYELVQGSIKKFCKSLNDKQQQSLPCELKEKIKEIIEEDSEKTVYRKNSNELTIRLLELGKLMSELINTYKGQEVEHYELITKVFEQQFDTEKEIIELKNREDLKASNVQSPEDMDCDYRKKGEQEIFGGYSINITETCAEEGLKLITAPEVKSATASDNEFYQSAVEKSKVVTGQKVEEAFADGAYHSQDNKTFNQVNEIIMILTGLQGKEGRFSFEYLAGELIVKDSQTGKVLKAELSKKGKRYKVEIEGKTYYKTLQDIENYFFRKQQESIPVEKLKRRNNVEASMFQLSFFTRNNKLRYRGLEKVNAWMYMRCLWINLVRIKNYMGGLCQKTTKNGINVASQAIKIIILTQFLRKIPNFEFYIKSNSLRIQWVYFF